MATFFFWPFAFVGYIYQEIVRHFKFGRRISDFLNEQD
jgi:hypothetical protein